MDFKPETNKTVIRNICDAVNALRDTDDARIKFIISDDNDKLGSVAVVITSRGYSTDGRKNIPDAVMNSFVTGITPASRNRYLLDIASQQPSRRRRRRRCALRTYPHFRTKL